MVAVAYTFCIVADILYIIAISCGSSNKACSSVLHLSVCGAPCMGYIIYFDSLLTARPHQQGNTNRCFFVEQSGKDIETRLQSTLSSRQARKAKCGTILAYLQVVSKVGVRLRNEHTSSFNINSSEILIIGIIYCISAPCFYC